MPTSLYLLCVQSGGKLHKGCAWRRVVSNQNILYNISLKNALMWINRLRMVYFCHQNQNAKNIGNFTTQLKPHTIGTHLKGIETSFQVVPFIIL
jgi:hypothetical protein